MKNSIISLAVDCTLMAVLLLWSVFAALKFLRHRKIDVAA